MKDILYDWHGLNVWLFHLINGIHGENWHHAMQWGTWLGASENFLAYLVALIMVSLWVCRRQNSTILAQWYGAVAVFAMGYGAESLVISFLKGYFHYPRPPVALAGQGIYVYNPATLSLMHSLPSGHTAFAALFAASIWPVLDSKWRILAALFVLWVACSRISLGAHFPADVFYGGLLSVVLVWLLRQPVKGALGVK